MVKLDQHNNRACYNTVQPDTKMWYVWFKIQQGDFEYHFLHER